MDVCEVCSKELTTEKEIYWDFHFKCQWVTFGAYLHDVQLYMYEDYGVPSTRYDSETAAANGWCNQWHVDDTCEVIWNELTNHGQKEWWE